MEESASSQNRDGPDERDWRELHVISQRALNDQTRDL